MKRILLSLILPVTFIACTSPEQRVTIIKARAVADLLDIGLGSQAVVLDVLANDSLEPRPTTITNVTAPQLGAVAIAVDGLSLVYDAPAVGAADSFSYTITDAKGETSSATVSLSLVDSPLAVADIFDLFKGGRGAPFAASGLTSNDVAGGSGETLAFESFDDSALSIPLVVDDQGTPDDLSDDILRYTAPADSTVTTETFEYDIRTSENLVKTGTVTINLLDQPACDSEIVKRKDSGLGWCYETYFDSHDGATEQDPAAATNIAMQVFVPHPWHQRQNAMASGIALGATETPFSPLLIHSHGFGGNKLEDLTIADGEEPVLDDQIARDAWYDGYNVISYTQRGFGGTPSTQGDNVPSEAPIGILSPNLEGFDFVRVVDWAICHFKADSEIANARAVDVNNDPVAGIHNVEDDNCGETKGESLLITDDGVRLASFNDDVALATVGYSYGGGYQFLAQSVDPRVDVIIPLGTWHDLRYSLHPNGAAKAFWIEIMNQFSGTTPGLGGGNGETLPTVLTTARTESNGTNVQPDDAPHGKRNQVSVASSRILAPKGPVAWCDNNHTEYFKKKYIDADPIQLADDSDQSDGATVCASDGNADPECEHPVDADTGAAGTPPAHYLPGRAPRANILMVQGYGDTLFNFNEGYDNARCFAEAGVEDVRFLAQTSGHPTPTVDGFIPENVIPPQYAGRNQGMYLDEIVHCGVDENQQPVRYNMVEVGKQFMDFHLRNGLLAEGVASADAIFPAVCVTQTNADPEYVLNEDDPFYSGVNSAVTGFKWSREGVVFDSLAEMAVGSNQNSNVNSQVLTIPPTSFATGAVAAQAPTFNAAEVYTATNPNGEVLAGIPLVDLLITRSNTTVDEVFFVGTYIQRCQLNPSNQPPYAASADDCDDPVNAPSLLHFQVTPVRVFPTAAASAQAATLPPATEFFPQLDPRNFIGDSELGTFYPVVFGDNPPTMPRSNGNVTVNRLEGVPNGRIPGVSARLYPFDKVGLALMAGHPIYLGVTTDGVGQVSVTGTVALPLVSAAPAIPLAPPASYVDTVAP